jgi:hypothetical protein
VRLAFGARKPHGGPRAVDVGRVRFAFGARKLQWGEVALVIGRLEFFCRLIPMADLLVCT